MSIVRYLVLFVLLRCSACDFVELPVEEVSLLQSSVETFRRGVDTEASCSATLDAKPEVAPSDDPFPTLGLVLRVLLRLGVLYPLYLRLRSNKRGTSVKQVELLELSLPASQGKVEPAALLDAVQKGDHGLCKVLLQNGIRPTVADTWGCSALHIAASCDAVEVARLLIENGADIEAVDAIDETPLHYAARRGCEAVAALLEELGANVDCLNMEGRTPLHLAGLSSHEGLCRLLLDKNATLGGIDDDELPATLTALLTERMVQGSSPIQLAEN